MAETTEQDILLTTADQLERDAERLLEGTNEMLRSDYLSNILLRGVNTASLDDLAWVLAGLAEVKDLLEAARRLRKLEETRLRSLR